MNEYVHTTPASATGVR